ncbi:hypothetical protein H4Q26_006107, partial [Puccinia striiformis f. sp. tritici PST-130]
QHHHPRITGIASNHEGTLNPDTSSSETTPTPCNPGSSSFGFIVIQLSPTRKYGEFLNFFAKTVAERTATDNGNQSREQLYSTCIFKTG